MPTVNQQYADTPRHPAEVRGQGEQEGQGRVCCGWEVAWGGERGVVGCCLHVKAGQASALWGRELHSSEGVLVRRYMVGVPQTCGTAS